jgi:hypothetical protein
MMAKVLLLFTSFIKLVVCSDINTFLIPFDKIYIHNYIILSLIISGVNELKPDKGV